MSQTDPGEDSRLVERIAGGDSAALGALYDRYAPHLLALSRRILGDAREAEDLVHDVFLELWRQAGDYDGARGTVRAWIVMRLRSRALDRLKAPRVARAVPLDGAHLDEPTVDEDPALAPDRAAIRRALAELPSEQRIVLELGYFEGLSSAEIALKVSCPVGTVKSRVAAGMAKLRAGLGLT